MQTSRCPPQSLSADPRHCAQPHSELHQPRLFCASAAHARLFVVAVDEGFTLQGLGLSGETE